MNTLPLATTTLPNACEPSVAVHLTFLVVGGSMSSVPDLNLPTLKWSGRFFAGEYMLRSPLLPPQVGQSLPVGAALASEQGNSKKPAAAARVRKAEKKNLRFTVFIFRWT